MITRTVKVRRVHFGRRRARILRLSNLISGSINFAMLLFEQYKHYSFGLVARSSVYGIILDVNDLVVAQITSAMLNNIHGDKNRFLIID